MLGPYDASFWRNHAWIQRETADLSGTALAEDSGRPTETKANLMVEPSLYDHCRPTATRRKLLVTTLLTEGGMLHLAALLGLLTGTPFWGTARVDAASVALGIGFGVALLPVALVLLESGLGFARRIQRDVRHLIGIFDHATLLDLLFISVLAGLGEEALFRGVLQPLAASWLGVPAAIVVVSLLFGAVHCLSWAYVAFATVLGAVFGVMQVWSDNIVVPMVAHAAYDFGALVYGVRLCRFRTDEPS